MFIGLLLPALAAASSGAETTGEHLGQILPLWSIIPFVGILLSIAIFPLLAPEFWHHHFPKISVFWALVLAIPFLIVYKGEAFYEILHIVLVDYIPFIVVLWGLYTVGGGIVLKGRLVGTPAVNVVLLLIGTALASWTGTTGAAMLLIRPVIRANAWRKTKMHIIIFFIFLVANIGGSLTPLGDPPLLLGFFHGVPFFWTLRLIVPMSFLVVILLVIFYLLDSFFMRKDGVTPPESSERDPIRLEGIYQSAIS
jgi:Na+/H+ antiporter NhaD/arsenite permease-like protein